MGVHQRRMGKVMPYTSPDGSDHPESFWVLDGLSVQIGHAQMILTFIGYHSVTSYDADKMPVFGAVKNYAITNPEFDGTINLGTIAPTGTPISFEILNMAWQVALLTKDVPVEGEESISFFEYAVDA